MTTATEEQVRETFRVPEPNLARLGKKFLRLAKKADQLGVEPVFFDVVGEETVAVTRMHGLEARAYTAENGYPPRDIEMAVGQELTETQKALGWFIAGTRTYKLVEVYGTAPKLAGWRFRGTLVHLDEAGNLLKTIIDDDEENVPARYREVGPWCEHCQLDRNRKDTFLVQNEETGEWKQVGRQCLADFLGHQSPEAIARYAELLADLHTDMREEAGAWGGSVETTLYVQDYLAVVAATIEKVGWTSKAKAREVGGASTSEVAEGVYWKRLDERDFPVTEQHEAEADTALTWARDLTEEELADNDFLWNLHVATKSDYTTPRAAGILAAVFIAKKFRDEGIERRKAQAEKAKASEYQGEVKKRQVFEGLRYVFGTSFEGYYGVTYLEKFVDADENVYVWFGKGLDHTINVGDELDVRATVKAHEEYEGTKQTVLTRLAVVEHRPKEDDDDDD